MKLKQLLTAIKYRAEQVPDVDITDLVYDSRKAVPGCAFVCLRGANADGHKYAKMAAEKVPPSSSQRRSWKRPCRSF